MIAISLLLYCIIAGVAGRIIFDKKSYGRALPLSFILHTTLVIISGLLLNDYRYGLYGTILFYTILVIFGIKRKLISISDTILRRDITIFAVLFLVLFFLNRNQVYTDWDEYSHWGPMIKESFRLNDFYFKSPRSFAHKDYVPFITVFEYIFCKLAGIYSEHVVYQAIQVFMISLIMPIVGLVEEIRYKSCSKIVTVLVEVLVIISYICSLIMLSSSFLAFNSIYTDLPFGLICGYTMVYTVMNSINSNKRDISSLFELSLVITAVIMTKMMGIIFVPVIIMMTCLITFSNIKVSLRIRYILLESIYPIIIWLLFKIQSSYYVNYTGGQSFDGAFNKIVSLITGGFTEDYQKETSINYLNAIFSDYSLIGSKGTYAIIIVCIILVMILLFAIYIFMVKNYKVVRNEMVNSDVDSKYKYMMLILGTFLTGIYYAIWMYILYMVSFGDYEAPRLASYNRYMGSYIASILIIVLYFIMNLAVDLKNNTDSINIFIIILLLFTIGIILYDKASYKFIDVYNRFYNNELAITEKETYLDTVNGITEYISDSSTIYFIEQNSNGNEKIHYNYYMMDKVEAIGADSIHMNDEEKYEGDVWSKICTEDELLDIIADYDYLYLDILDEYFKEDYGNLFDGSLEEGNLYKVSADNGKVKLEYIENVLNR